METTIVYWGYIGIMEEKMETTILFYCIEVGPDGPLMKDYCNSYYPFWQLLLYGGLTQYRSSVDPPPSNSDYKGE